MKSIKNTIFQYLNFLLFSVKGGHMVYEKVQSVFDIDYKKLHDQGVRLFIFDIDDTLCPSKSHLPEKTKCLLSELTEKNDPRSFVGILSNCGNERKKMITEELKPLKISIENDPYKPATQGYEKIMARFGVSPNDTAMIGDRIGTDMWGAYRSGINKCILTEPFSSSFGGRKHIFIIRSVRFVEKKFMPLHDPAQ